MMMRKIWLTMLVAVSGLCHGLGDPAADLAAFCRTEAAKAGEEGRAVVVGADGWLFLASELRHLGVGKFWGEAAQEASQATRADARDPLPAILETARQLKERDITLLLLPVPPRAVVYADKLLPATPRGEAGVPERVDASLQEFYALLEKEGVNVLDVMPALLQARKTDKAEGPVYCQQDSHWSPRGIAMVAGAVADWLLEQKLIERGPLKTGSRKSVIELQGDLRGLKGAVEQAAEKIALEEITEEGGAALADNPAAPILLLSDSHGLVFQDGGDMHATGGGLAAHLAAHLGMTIDRMARRGSAATPVRIDLARRIRSEADFATEKKVVIWCFAARELTESAGWRLVPLFPR